jgi:hypothetical protein
VGNTLVDARAHTHTHTHTHTTNNFVEEFETGLKKLGYKTTNKKLDHIMKELDVDQDGHVEFTEVLPKPLPRAGMHV